MIPVKICGITSLKSAQLAVHAGASAIGFIFFPQSPRYVMPDIAASISRQVPNHIARVGIFVNEKTDTIHSMVKTVGLDFLQLYPHQEKLDELSRKYSVISAIQVKNDEVPSLPDGNISAYLLDTYRDGKFGGTGESFDWKAVQNLATEVPIILSGGLNPDNILKAIQTVKPQAVDVNSGVETSLGVKDHQKLIHLFEILQSTGNYPNLFERNITESH
ncbi:MAG: phosphoribosylanthranilate isomerase [Candidatus Marinimicrobia bacterium]|nr:phosphoribosylanthranilate isomerase [Candidatus Neomarinimicrobiota bacterium]